MLLDARCKALRCGGGGRKYQYHLHAVPIGTSTGALLRFTLLQLALIGRYNCLLSTNLVEYPVTALFIHTLKATFV